jgi:hypothetical protein
LNTLSLDTAYRSFGGEVESSSNPTICRLSDSCRHQLSAIAPCVVTPPPSSRDSLSGARRCESHSIVVRRSEPGSICLDSGRLAQSTTVDGLSSDRFGAGGGQGTKSRAGLRSYIVITLMAFRHDARIDRDVHIPSACAIVPASCIRQAPEQLLRQLSNLVPI